MTEGEKIIGVERVEHDENATEEEELEKVYRRVPLRTEKGVE